jgi:hypothetical protein
MGELGEYGFEVTQKIIQSDRKCRAKGVPQNVPQIDANQALHARYASHAR